LSSRHILQAVMPLANLLSDKSEVAALRAAYALAGLGPAAEAALPHLRRAVDIGGDKLREATANAILKISK
jgi:hypothetical protein